LSDTSLVSNSSLPNVERKADEDDITSLSDFSSPASLRPRNR
jgi:hypothetical protein